MSVKEKPVEDFQSSTKLRKGFFKPEQQTGESQNIILIIHLYITHILLYIYYTQIIKLFFIIQCRKMEKWRETERKRAYWLQCVVVSMPVSELLHTHAQAHIHKDQFSAHLGRLLTLVSLDLSPNVFRLEEGKEEREK